jgi:hypothetical protein
MIKEALEYLVGISQKRESLKIGGRDYEAVPGTMALKMMTPPLPEPLYTSTLSGVYDYASTFDATEFLIHVSDFNEVSIIGRLDESYKTRETHLVSKAFSGNFKFGLWLDIEQFIISLMACFENSDSRISLLSFLGSIQVQDSVVKDDNGVSQRVTVKKGVTSLVEATVPNPVSLRPYVTFPEVGQPFMDYVFRLRRVGSADSQKMECALFSTDSQEWKMNCIIRIRDWLKGQLPEVSIIA